MTTKNYPSEEYRLLEGLKKYCNFTPGKRYPVGIGDDAAIRRCLKGEQLVLTADILVENIHFSFDYMSPGEIGYRAMAANISDCAAMGAAADSALIQMVFPAQGGKRIVENMILKMYTGIYRACKRWGFPVIGGDLSSGPCWVIAVSLTGRKNAAGRLLKRTGCRVGDDLWVSGIPGMSEAGLDVLKKWGRARFPAEYRRLVQAHIAPKPDIDLGLKLAADTTVHAAIDLSDGISKECYTLCHENGVGIDLKPGRDCVPGPLEMMSTAFDKPASYWFLYGGEDYKLLFTASRRFDPDRYRGTDLYKIGEVTGKRGRVLFTDSDGTAGIVEKRAWDHLRK